MNVHPGSFSKGTAPPLESTAAQECLEATFGSEGGRTSMALLQDERRCSVWKQATAPRMYTRAAAA